MFKLGNYFVKVYHGPKIKKTVVQLFDKNYSIIGVGEAKCHEYDQYDRKKGRKIALSRAIVNADIPKEERYFLWEDYRTSLTESPRWEVASV